MNDLFGNLFSVGGGDLFDTEDGNLFSLTPPEPPTGILVLLLGNQQKLLGRNGKILGREVDGE